MVRGILLEVGGEVCGSEGWFSGVGREIEEVKDSMRERVGYCGLGLG